MPRHTPRSAWLAASCAALLLGSATARAEPAEAKVGLQLELQLLALYRYHAESSIGRAGVTPIDQSGVELGPLPSEDDFGAQVPVQLGAVFPVAHGLGLGARFGLAPTCLDGPELGDEDPDMNWQLQPFARYVFGAVEAIQFYVQGGPFVGHSCVGDSVDRDVSNLYGLHLGWGLEHDFTQQLSLNAELRGLSAWGEHQFRSHGEVPERFDGFDLRGQLLIGVSVWF
jgi:hypothetical protein